MSGYFYPFKICDPVHGFIRFNEWEKKVINSAPFQRLRYIKQMGVAYLLYPGANHTRFEHSLGVMELVTRIYDSMTSPYHLEKTPSHLIPSSKDEREYWRQILRFAALCHDLGHLPFSHTAERDLLSEGGHERMTIRIIQSPLMRSLWSSFGPHAESDILKLAVCEKELKACGIATELSDWEKVLSQAITDDNFGADRIDYLIRDARYTGVGYGHFDFHQLIDTLRILPSLQETNTFSIGVSRSGIQSVESLWIARYLMYARVYHHPKARVYTLHMSRFMCDYYQEVGFPEDPEAYLKETDFAILTAVSKSEHLDARILMKQKPSFKEIPLKNFPLECSEECIFKLKQAFSKDILIDHLPQIHFGEEKHHSRYFSVIDEEGQTVLSVNTSTFLRDIPQGGSSFYLFANKERIEEVKNWINSNNTL